MRYSDFKIVEAALNKKKYFDPSEEQYSKGYQQRYTSIL